jgi:hypothetical protein
MRVACEPRVDVVLQRHLAPGQKGQRGGEQPAVLADLTLTVAWQTFFQAYMAGPIVLVFWIGTNDDAKGTLMLSAHLGAPPPLPCLTSSY